LGPKLGMSTKIELYSAQETMEEIMNELKAIPLYGKIIDLIEEAPSITLLLNGKEIKANRKLLCQTSPIIAQKCANWANEGQEVIDLDQLGIDNEQIVYYFILYAYFGPSRRIFIEERFNKEGKLNYIIIPLFNLLDLLGCDYSFLISLLINCAYSKTVIINMYSVHKEKLADHLFEEVVASLPSIVDSIANTSNMNVMIKAIMAIQDDNLRGRIMSIAFAKRYKNKLPGHIQKKIDERRYIHWAD
jgi:hypothetical protein